MLIRRFCVFLTFLAFSLAGQTPEPYRCATDPDTATRVRNFHRANRLAATAAAPAAEMRNGMFVVPKSPINAVLDHPNDLEGKSVRFVPTGTDRYTATVGPLEYDTNLGSTARHFVATSQSGWQSMKVDLKNVKLPLFGQSVSTIYVTAFNSIALSEPSLDYSAQFDRTQAAFADDATVAPLLLSYSQSSWLNMPDAYVRETSDGVLVTWRASNNVFNYDVQAKIFANGDILFSYKSLGTMTWGAAVITPGAGAFILRLTPVGQIEDPADDVDSSIPAALRKGLDIRGVAVQQVSGTGAYAIFINLGGDPKTSLPPRGDSYVYTVTVGDMPTTLTLSWNGAVTVAQPGRPVASSQIAGFIANQIEFAVFSDTFDPIRNPTRITVESSLLSSDTPADSASLDVTMTDGQTPGVDLSAANGTELQLPIVEAFTLPVIDLQSVWESVRAAGAFTDNDIDGVAIYENFNSDVALIAAAFATIGNSGTDGIWKYVRHGSAWPRSPNLMQMNIIGRGNNNDTLGAAGTLMHEFGHRWLQFVETIENGSAQMTLNPSPAHPPQFANTPAAFPAVNSYDASTMGGGNFTQSGNTFTAGPWSAYGYSWFDLYLMGLATADEVPAMYVIDNSNPPLAAAYTPPSNISVTGTRHDVGIQQVIDAMGPRKPSAAASQRIFKVAFVLITDPSRPADADLATVDRYRGKFAEIFGRATGQRAVIQTLFFPPEPRKRAVK